MENESSIFLGGAIALIAVFAQEMDVGVGIQLVANILHCTKKVKENPEQVNGDY